MTVLLAVLRLLWSKTGYDEVTRPECQPAIDGVFRCLESEDHTVSYPAALVVSRVNPHIFYMLSSRIKLLCKVRHSFVRAKMLAQVQLW